MVGSLSGSCGEVIVSAITERGLGRIHLVSGHRQRINITLFRGAATLELEGKLLRVQKLRCHVADSSWLATRRGTRFHERRIGDDTSHPEVPQARSTIISDQDVSLDRANIGARFELGRAQRSPD